MSQPQINQLSYGRLLIPRLIDEDVVLYLECDLDINYGEKEFQVIDYFTGHHKLLLGFQSTITEQVVSQSGSHVFEDRQVAAMVLTIQQLISQKE